MARSKLFSAAVLSVISLSFLLMNLLSPSNLRSVFAEETSAAAKVSSFAPVKVVEAELKYFVGKMEKELEDEEEFGEDQHERLTLDSATVAVLALTLGMHDQKTEYKSAAGKIVEFATELADNADDFEAATEAYGNLKKAIDEKPKAVPLSWDEPVADIAALMRQVPIVNDRVRRGVNDKRRF